MIEYTIEKNLAPEEFKQVLVNSTLGERRPVNDDERIKKMIQGANLIITARLEGKLVGVARSLSDFSFCTYLSDLAVDEQYQHRGIGKELIRQTKLASPQATLLLVSAPKAVDYYPRIGMSKRDHCFMLTDIDDLK
jgi:ribosomal protein S18 acetylase RimI-like enzyme